MKQKTEYLKWNGDDKEVKYLWYSPMRKFTPSVVRSLPEDKVSWELYDAIYDADTGVFNDKTAQAMSARDRSSWVHLWDAYNCETVSAMEAYDAISLGYVPYNLCVRASNYMHLI